MTKVLVVDDTPDMARLVAKIVSDLTDKVLIANNGHTALQIALEEHPDLVLLDVMMPEMSGLEVLQGLTANEQTRDTPVILVTANGEDNDIIRGLDAGAFDYVTKPFRREVLAARVRSALRFKRSGDELHSANKRLKQALSEQHRMELELAQTQKLESIGRLAAGIAHEINTPTQYIGDNTRFVRDVFNDLKRILDVLDRLERSSTTEATAGELLQDLNELLQDIDVNYIKMETPIAIEQSLEGIDRVTNIVRAMKEFSHPGQCEKQPVDLNRAIQSTITVSRNEWKYVANVVTDLEDNLPLVPCLVADFNQAMLNLIVNAAQAIGNTAPTDSGVRGTITVRTRRDGDWIEISIADDGVGIPQDIQDKVFDHFFTTKEVGKGTGQGLSIVQAVISQKHGGAVHFDSQEGIGTTFFLRLPIDAPEQNSESANLTAACKL